MDIDFDDHQLKAVRAFAEWLNGQDVTFVLDTIEALASCESEAEVRQTINERHPLPNPDPMQGFGAPAPVQGPARGRRPGPVDAGLHAQGTGGAHAMNDVVHFTYRLAYFNPNPTVLWRIPFAVFVKYGGGCFVGIAPLLPDAGYLGSKAQATMLRHAIDEITAEPLAYQGHDFSGKLGPHFEIGGTEHSSTRERDVVAWATATLLPH